MAACLSGGKRLEAGPYVSWRDTEVRPIAGDPFDPVLVGPSSAFWGRGPEEEGRVFYVTADGGRTAPPPDGIVRKASLLRVELQPATAPAEENS